MDECSQRPCNKSDHLGVPVTSTLKDSNQLVYIYNTYIYIYMLVSDPHIGVDERNSMESLDHEEEANWTMDGC